MKFKIAATIPTVRYGNLIPEIEVEAKTYEEAKAIVLPKIEELWAQYCEPGSELRVAGESIEVISDVTGGKAYLEPISHTYTDTNGIVMLSGSAFAERYVKPFDKETILPAVAKKLGISEADVDKMWGLKATIASGFGTALHEAMELYGRFKELPGNPVIRKIVENFYKQFPLDDKLEYIIEPFVVDQKRRLAGQIDRFVVLDKAKKICRIQDYKTNADLEKKGKPANLLSPFNDLPNTKLNQYWLQLSFYAEIVKAAGWLVEGMDIYHFNGKWAHYETQPIDISEALGGKEDESKTKPTPGTHTTSRGSGVSETDNKGRPSQDEKRGLGAGKLLTKATGGEK